jgi:hypothetical protein
MSNTYPVTVAEENFDEFYVARFGKPKRSGKPILAQGIIKKNGQPILVLDEVTGQVLDEAGAAGAFGGGGSSVNFAGRNVIYVSKGSAATDTRGTLSKYDANVPFATLTAALTASSSGDLIIVEPGTYTGIHILKDGVDIHLHAGAILYYDGEGAENYDGTSTANSTLGDGGQAVTCKITGAGSITRYANNPGTWVGTQVWAFSIQNGSSDVYLQCNSIEASTANDQAAPVGIYVYNGNVEVHCPYIYSNAYDAILYGGQDSTPPTGSEDSVLLIYTNEIVAADNPVEVTNTNGNAVVYAYALRSIGNISIGATPNQCVNVLKANCFVSCFEMTQGSSFVSKIVEHSGTGTSTIDCPNIKGTIRTGGSVILQNSKVVPVLSEECISASAGASVVLVNTRLITAATNSVIKTGASTNPIIKPMGCWSNKAVGANVTQQVGTVTVDANVS